MKILEEFHKELTALFEKYDAGIAIYMETEIGDPFLEVFTTSSKSEYIGIINTWEGSVGIDQNTTYNLINPDE